MDSTAPSSNIDVLNAVADLVAAYVSDNRVPTSDLPMLIGNVHTALKALSGSAAVEGAKAARATPAEIRKSITHDALVSFEDGKPYKTLRRHLTLRGLTPEAYRDKHGLPSTYPMTSAAYSAQRSELAKTIGLGQLRSRVSTKSLENERVLDEAAPPKRRGRPPAKAKAETEA
ncbi:MucR family transcriptional regulator [Methylobacterium sp. Leaf399]|uniref:MucR family transcriptional regulator n=1 Tax=Methylobacterium sp. Leaf399 TaxID=1736364 RepID=UPI0009E66079|nr:MucR family transcriptional regulator [Methylobacterium sp. Leaf399]